MSSAAVVASVSMSSVFAPSMAGGVAAGDEDVAPSDDPDIPSCKASLISASTFSSAQATVYTCAQECSQSVLLLQCTSTLPPNTTPLVSAPCAIVPLLQTRVTVDNEPSVSPSLNPSSLSSQENHPQQQKQSKNAYGDTRVKDSGKQECKARDSMFTVHLAPLDLKPKMEKDVPGSPLRHCLEQAHVDAPAPTPKKHGLYCRMFHHREDNSVKPPLPSNSKRKSEEESVVSSLPGKAMPGVYQELPLSVKDPDAFAFHLTQRLLLLADAQNKEALAQKAASGNGSSSSSLSSPPGQRIHLRSKESSIFGEHRKDVLTSDEASHSDESPPLDSPLDHAFQDQVGFNKQRTSKDDRKKVGVPSWMRRSERQVVRPEDPTLSASEQHLTCNSRAEPSTSTAAAATVESISGKANQFRLALMLFHYHHRPKKTLAASIEKEKEVKDKRNHSGSTTPTLGALSISPFDVGLPLDLRCDDVVDDHAHYTTMVQGDAIFKLKDVILQHRAKASENFGKQVVQCQENAKLCQEENEINGTAAAMDKKEAGCKHHPSAQADGGLFPHARCIDADPRHPKSRSKILADLKDFITNGFRTPVATSGTRTENVSQTDLHRTGHSSGYNSDMESAASTGTSTPRYPEHPAHVSDKYGRQQRKVGSGACGVVRIASLPYCNKKYAVKEFRRKRSKESERDYIKKITSEFCIGSVLHHGNIIETLDIIHDGDRWYEVMEYCDGGDLYTAIQSGLMTSDEIDCCFHQLIMGVQYLHSVGVAHRDLKPENLLLDNLGHLKIADFGISDVFRNPWEVTGHDLRGVCGSPPYVAPEVYSRDHYDATKVDVWACGIVYYAMRFSGIPWRQAVIGDMRYEMYLSHGSIDFPPFNSLPEGPFSLLQGMLHPDPQLRITIDDIISHDWFHSIPSCYVCSGPSPSNNTSGSSSSSSVNVGHACAGQNSGQSSGSNLNSQTNQTTAAPIPPTHQHHGTACISNKRK